MYCRRAVFHVRSSGRNEVTGANVLVAIFSEQESQAAYLLRKHEVSRLDVVNFISHGTRKDEPTQSSDPGSQPNSEEQAGGEERMEIHDEPESACARGRNRPTDWS